MSIHSSFITFEVVLAIFLFSNFQSYLSFPVLYSLTSSYFYSFSFTLLILYISIFFCSSVISVHFFVGSLPSSFFEVYNFIFFFIFAFIIFLVYIRVLLSLPFLFIIIFSLLYFMIHYRNHLLVFHRTYVVGLLLSSFNVVFYFYCRYIPSC